MKKETVILVLKVVIAICTAILSVLGVSALTSCSVSHDSISRGTCVVVTTDTTYINHTGTLTFKK